MDKTNIKKAKRDNGQWTWYYKMKSSGDIQLQCLLAHQITHQILLNENT